MGEMCRRVKVAGINTIDPEAELEYRKRQMVFLNPTNQKKEKKTIA